MHDRDTLVFSLTAIARRLHFCTVAREASWAACVISSALVVYQILAALIPAPAVMSALRVLLILLLVGTIGFFAVRIVRRTTLAQAAAMTDAHSDLKDELKTAYWFARQDHAAPLIELQIRRAALAAQKLNPRELFAIIIPRRAFAAAGLALVAGLLAWFAPRFDYGQTTRTERLAMVAPEGATVAHAGLGLPNPAAAADMEKASTGNEKAWANFEAKIQSLGHKPGLEDIAAAIKSRDSARATQLLQELNRKREFAQAPAAGSAVTGSAPVPASADLLARLKDLFSPGGGAPQPDFKGGALDELTQALNVAQKLSEENSARANNPANHTADEATSNPLQAGVPLERFGPRETRRSQTQGGEFAGTTDVEGGAMGRRVTQTSIGAGGKPSSNETSDNNNIEAGSVLGKRTMRLAAKLERIKIEGTRSEGDDAQGVTDAIYASTRAQQAQLSYQNASQHARYVGESAMSGERVPLAYRGAVKEYFLNLNQRDP
jgi:hypothetical protein